jgi:hypothetical protein
MRCQKKDYFLLIPAAASRAAPIAARMMAVPTGDFCVTAFAAGQEYDGDGVAGTASDMAGACTCVCTGACAVAWETAAGAVVDVAILTVDIHCLKQ